MHFADPMPFTETWPYKQTNWNYLETIQERENKKVHFPFYHLQKILIFLTQLFLSTVTYSNRSQWKGENNRDWLEFENLTKGRYFISSLFFFSFIMNPGRWCKRFYKILVQSTIWTFFLLVTQFDVDKKVRSLLLLLFCTT